jgi:hypothetical protein
MIVVSAIFAMKSEPMENNQRAFFIGKIMKILKQKEINTSGAKGFGVGGGNN